MTRLQVNLDPVNRAKAEQRWREREAAIETLTRRALWRGILWALLFQAIAILVVWAILTMIL